MTLASAEPTVQRISLNCYEFFVLDFLQEEFRQIAIHKISMKQGLLSLKISESVTVLTASLIFKQWISDVIT